MTENEMTNQAAQTMPELPASRGYLSLYHSGGVAQVNGYTADQMQQYARDYAAALTREAPTVAVFDGDRFAAGVEAAAQLIEGARDAICQEAKVKEDQADLLEELIDGLRALSKEATPPAPQRHPDALPDGTLSKSMAKRLAAALVSERARAASLKEIVPAEKRNYLDDNGNPRSIEDEAYAHGWNACRAATLRALEHALTQQRGHGEAVDRDAWAEALELPQGYTVEEFLPGGWHYAWTRADGERMVSGTTWNHPALAAIAAWQYAPATTPQPSADAVRELVRRAYEVVHHDDECPAIGGCGDKDCRCDAVPFLRELESLLSGGSHA